MDYKEKVIELLKSKELSKEEKDKLADIFPELTESEDEIIRKGLIRIVSNWKEGHCSWNSDKEFCDDVLAWLEKQESIKTPQWMIGFLDKNRSKFASLMDDYDEQREAEGNLLAIISWLEKQGTNKNLVKMVESEWSAEDEHRLGDAIYFLDTARKHYASDSEILATIKWLESIKERITYYGK